jgi:phosphatidylinositol-4,5-bisphosphate 3-kinase catalytic subunit alpha/beta/delta
MNQEDALKQTQDSYTNFSKEELSWIADDQYSIHLDNLTYLPYLKDCDKLFFKVSIYHGQDLVTNIESERFDLEKLGKDSSLKLNQSLNLGIKVKSLHRTAKLCLSLYCISKKKREFFSIGWVSLNLFDFKGRLLNGNKKIYLWHPLQSSSLSYESLSEVSGQNPDKDYIRVHLDFLRSDRNIIYPQIEEIKNFIKKTSDISQDDCFDCIYALENDNSLLENILNKDALAELSEQEKNVLWRRREDCLNYPSALPKLYQAVKWTNPKDVAEVLFNDIISV